MADAEVSQASGRKPVRVQLPPPARPRSGLTHAFVVPRLRVRLARLLRRLTSQYERRWSDPSALGLSAVARSTTPRYKKLNLELRYPSSHLVERGVVASCHDGARCHGKRQMSSTPLVAWEFEFPSA